MGHLWYDCFMGISGSKRRITIGDVLMGGGRLALLIEMLVASRGGRGIGSIRERIVRQL